MSPLETLLLAVARRLRRERLAGAARYAAWGSVLVALLAMLLHLFVRPVSKLELLFGVALIGLLAAWQAFVNRATPADCADWADRQLGGRSAYATCLEVVAQPRGRLAPAVAHLDGWVAQAVPTSLATLAARPFGAGLRKPLAAALVCSALALVLLQLPTRARAPDATAAATGAAIPAAIVPDGTGPGVQSRPDAATTSDTRPAGLATQAKERGTPTTVTAPAGTRDAAVQQQAHDGESAAAARTSSRPAATGREAGDVADVGGENVLTAPSQHELAAQLREIAMQAPRSDLRADAAQAADFEGESVAAGPSGNGSLVAAPATPPPASAAPLLAPAEQAFLRAYWSDRRTNP